MSLLEVKNLQKTYYSDGSNNPVHSLKGIDLSVKKQDYIAIMGESGSGKSTLLNILACLDKASSGIVKINGVDTQQLKDDEMCAFRLNNIGFIFQDFNILDIFTCRENIMLPLVLAKHKTKEIDPLVDDIAKSLNITTLLDKYPYELSGGQKQRVAIARALINHPGIILADEPTGSLDSKNSEEVLNIFDNLNHQGNTILMVTHSTKAASHANKVLFIRDGKIFHEIHRGNRNNNELFKEINDSLSVINNGGELND